MPRKSIANFKHYSVPNNDVTITSERKAQNLLPHINFKLSTDK